MSDLPGIIQRVPSLFYGAAVIVFIWSFGLSYFEAQAGYRYADSSVDGVLRLVALRSLYQAFLEALYVAANGVLAHILLAIWRGGSIPPAPGGRE